LDLLHEIAEGLAQRVGVEISGTDHIEAGGLQSLGDQAGVVGRGRKRRLGIRAVADYQGDALLLLLRGGGIKTPRKGRGQKQAQRKKEKGSGEAHGFSAHR